MRHYFIAILITLSVLQHSELNAQSIISTNTYPQTLSALGSVTISAGNRVIDSVWIQTKGIMQVNNTSTTIQLAANAYNAIAYTDSVSTAFAFVVELLDPRSTLSFDKITCGNNSVVTGQCNAHVTRIEIRWNTTVVYSNNALPANGEWITLLPPGIFSLVVYDSTSNSRTYNIGIQPDYDNLWMLNSSASSFCGLPTGSADIVTDFPVLSVSVIGTAVVSSAQRISLSQLPAGANTVIVQMRNNCTDTLIVNIPIKPAPEILTETKGISCSQSADGEVLMQIKAPTPFSLTFKGAPLAYLSGFPLSGLTAGADSIQFADTDGCLLSLSFSIDTAYTDCFDKAPNAMLAGDTWDLLTPSGERMQDIYLNTTVKIFDARGNLVTDTLPWNGTYADGKQAEGVFYWIAEGTYTGNGFIHIFPKN